MTTFIDYLRESKIIVEDGETNVVAGMATWTPPIAMTSRKFGGHDEFLVKSGQYHKISEAVKRKMQRKDKYLDEFLEEMDSNIKDGATKSVDESGAVVFTNEDSVKSIIVQGKRKKQLHNEFTNNDMATQG